MKSLFFGFLEAIQDQEQILSYSRKGLQNQSSNYQYNFIKGLEAYKDVKESEVYALPSFGSFLISYKKLIIHKKEWVYEKSAYHSPSFLNLPLIKQVFWLASVLNYLLNLDKRDKRFLIHFYSIHPVWFLVNYFLKIKNFDQRILIIPDLPNWVLSSIEKTNLISNLKMKLFKKLLSSFNGYVVVNENIAKRLSLKKYTVIDGFVNEKTLKQTKKSVNLKYSNSMNKEIIFLYAGNMGMEFGINDLVKAFLESKQNIKLYLFGDIRDKNLINIINNSNKISFFGYISKEKLEHYYNITDAFIIPRNPMLFVNKYSHPSKVYEYLTYFKPVLMYKFENIFLDSVDIVYYFNRHHFEAITDGIKKFASSFENKPTNSDSYQKTYSFLLNKLPSAQIERHLNLIKSWQNCL